MRYASSCFLLSYILKVRSEALTDQQYIFNYFPCITLRS